MRKQYERQDQAQREQREAEQRRTREQFGAQHPPQRYAADQPFERPQREPQPRYEPTEPSDTQLRYELQQFEAQLLFEQQEAEAQRERALAEQHREAQRQAEAKRQFELARQYEAQRRAHQRPRTLPPQSATAEPPKRRRAKPLPLSASVEQEPTQTSEVPTEPYRALSRDHAAHVLMAALAPAPQPEASTLWPETAEAWDAARKPGELLQLLQREAVREREEREREAARVIAEAAAAERKRLVGDEAEPADTHSAGMPGTGMQDTGMQGAGTTTSPPRSQPAKKRRTKKRSPRQSAERVQTTTGESSTMNDLRTKPPAAADVRHDTDPLSTGEPPDGLTLSEATDAQTDAPRPQAPRTKARLRPPPVPPAALARTAPKALTIPPPPVRSPSLASSMFDEILTETKHARPSAPPALPSSRPSSRPPMQTVFVGASEESAPLAQAGETIGAAYGPASNTPTRGTPIPGRAPAADSASLFDTFPEAGTSMAIPFAAARPTTRPTADDYSDPSLRRRPFLLRFAPIAAALVAIAGGTYWVVQQRPVAPAPDATIVTSVQHEEPATPPLQPLITAPAPAQPPAAAPEPAPSASGSERRHHHHHHRSHSRDADDDSASGSADASSGTSRREQRRLAHEQRVAARHERRRLAKGGGDDERKARTAPEEDSSSSRSSRREAAAEEKANAKASAKASAVDDVAEPEPTPSRRGKASAKASAADDVSEPAPTPSRRAPEPVAAEPTPTRSTSSSRTATAASSTSRTATPASAPAAPPPPKKPVSMDEMLDRVGPAKPAPAKPASAADMELDELLRKSLKTGK